MLTCARWYLATTLSSSCDEREPSYESSSSDFNSRGGKNGTLRRRGFLVWEQPFPSVCKTTIGKQHFVAVHQYEGHNMATFSSAKSCNNFRDGWGAASARNRNH